jgi:8-oxo-dGTP pyrophosphatase MutT (NUDIX family)
MYKVFFKDRTVLIGKDVNEFKSDLFYRYGSRIALESLIDAYFYLNEIHEFSIIHDDDEHLWDEFQSIFKPITAAGGIVKNPDGEILFILRNGIWDLPKGKTDRGETIENSALREVREECGISHLTLGSKLIETYHAYLLEGDKVLKRTYWFEMLHPGGEDLSPQTEENITEIKWIKPDQLQLIKANTYPLIIEVLKTSGIKI